MRETDSGNIGKEKADLRNRSAFIFYNPTISMFPTMKNLRAVDIVFISLVERRP